MLLQIYRDVHLIIVHGFSSYINYDNHRKDHIPCKEVCVGLNYTPWSTFLSYITLSMTPLFSLKENHWSEDVALDGGSVILVTSHM